MALQAFFVRIDNDAFIFAKCYQNRSDQILLTRYSLKQTNLNKSILTVCTNQTFVFCQRAFFSLELPFQPPT